VALADNNVPFVDDVDRSTGARIIDAMAVSRAMPGSAGQIAPIVERLVAHVVSSLQYTKRIATSGGAPDAVPAERRR
jgi:hypothetical protein